MAGGEEEGAPLTQGSPLLRGANQGRFTGWGPKVGARGVRKRGVDCERCFRSLGRVAQESLLRSSFGAMALCLTLLLDLVPLHSCPLCIQPNTKQGRCGYRDPRTAHCPCPTPASWTLPTRGSLGQKMKFTVIGEVKARRAWGNWCPTRDSVCHGSDGAAAMPPAPAAPCPSDRQSPSIRF